MLNNWIFIAFLLNSLVLFSDSLFCEIQPTFLAETLSNVIPDDAPIYKSSVRLDELYPSIVRQVTLMTTINRCWSRVHHVLVTCYFVFQKRERVCIISYLQPRPADKRHRSDDKNHYVNHHFTLWNEVTRVTILPFFVLVVG